MTKEKSSSGVGTGAGASKATTTDPSGPIMNSVSAPASAGAEIPITIASDVADTAAGPAQANKSIVQNKSALLGLPQEIKQKIWTLAVTVDGSIEPFQVRPKSNKFYWSLNQAQKGADDMNAEPLTVVQLTKVCQQIYQEVSLTNLFYQVNSFSFDSTMPTGATTYLVAITAPRRHAIRSLSIPWAYYGKKMVENMFTMVGACQGLQSLEIDLDRLLGSWGFYGPAVTRNRPTTSIPGYKEWQVAIRGLKTLNIKYDLKGTHAVRGKEIQQDLNEFSEEQLSMVRGTGVNTAKVVRAQLAVNLDIHGEGRLTEDKKPGVVSSRTRQGIRDVAKVADDGTLPSRGLSKYDLNGDLAWKVRNIEAVREVKSGDDVLSIEFKISCGPTWFKGGEDTCSWEDVSNLNSFNAREEIVDYYTKDLEAPGKQIVLDTWKLRAVDEEYSTRHKRSPELHLEKLIHKENKQAEQVKQAEAARIAKDNKKKAKAKAAKNSKKATR